MLTTLFLLLHAAGSGEVQTPLVPVAFVENLGQWRPSIRYVAKTPAYTAWFEADRFWVKRVGRERSAPWERGEEVSARGAVLCFELPGEAAAIEPGAPLPGMHHYLRGERTEWVTHVPGYATLVYREVAPGVDLRFRKGPRGLEYDLLAEPGADPGAVPLRVHGAEGIAVGPDGRLRIGTAMGPMEHTAPVAWEELGRGERRPVEAGFRVSAEGGSFQLEAPSRDPGRSLVIDPGIVWGTYLGGTSGDLPRGVDIDGRGYVYVAGHTGSNDFPTTPGAFDQQGEGPFSLDSDAFVTRLAADGASLVYSTYLGDPNEQERALALAVDGDERAVITGYTDNHSFPTTAGAADPSYDGTGFEAFVTRLAEDGSSLYSSTFLGGSKAELAFALVLDGDGNAVVGGQTWSLDFPVTPGAFQPSFGGGLHDGFVSVVSPDAKTILGSTYFGGTDKDNVWNLSWHADSGIALVGDTRSKDLPITPGAVDGSIEDAGTDGFAARLAGLNGPLHSCTYMGGGDYDVASSVALDAAGRMVVGGVTASADFPLTSGAFDTALDTPNAGFITLLDEDATSQTFSTLFESSSGGTGGGIVDLSSGVVTGLYSSVSGTIPVTPGGVEVTPSTVALLRLHPSGSKLMYASTIGGEVGQDFVRDAEGQVVAVVETFGNDFDATPGAYDTTPNGGQDGGVVKVDPLPTGVSRFGISTPACDGPVRAGVDSMPYSGNDAFHVTCEGASPSAVGALGVGFTSDPTGIPALNVTLHVPAPVLIAPTASDAYGWAEAPLPIASSIGVGAQVFAQHVWINTPDCGAPAPLSASDALAITVQPALP